MAGVQGMAFSTGGLPSAANKERGGFCWQDAANEAGSADFFDQYVELGESDAESVSGGGGGLGQFGGASDPAASPHLSFGQLLPPTPGGAGGALPGSQLLHANPVDNAASRAPRARQNHQQLHPHYRAPSSMTDYSNPELVAAGVPYGSVGDVPGGGSISDSELLKLEGLSMRSLRIQLPQLSASEPASPPSHSTSPRKTGRLESFCNKIRNKAATLHGKGKQQQQLDFKTEAEAALSMPVMSTAQMEPARSATKPRPQNLQLSKAQLPSPPLTSGMPNQAQRPVAGNSEASFVNGLLDDPFAAENLGQFVPPLQLNGTAMPQTPLQTPLLHGWQMSMLTHNGKPLWTDSAAYFPGVNGDATNTWWDASADAMDTDPVPLTFNAVSNARNASLNLAIGLQHQPSFEYPAPPGTEDSFGAGGLMMHMPQPRGVPSAAVLHSGDPHHRPTRADHHRRRPKPRAPSSGARHHQYGPGVSPRKTRTASGGNGNGSSAGRLSSASPSPKVSAASLVGSSGGRLHRRSASMQTLHQPASVALSATATDGAAIRKRRSWTGRRASSTSLHHQYHNTLAAAAAAAESPSRRCTAGANAGAAGAAGGGPSSTSSAASSASSSASSRPVSLTSATFAPYPDPSLLHHPQFHPDLFPTSHQPTPFPNQHNPTATATSRHTKSHARSHSHTHTHHPYPPSDHATTTTTTGNPPGPSSSLGKQRQDPSSGFVNYTPQDRTLLMTGVAPSGSSKTKARREREAAERQRAFRDKLARVVQAAGGDVSKLELGLVQVGEGDVVGMEDGEGGDIGVGGDGGEHGHGFEGGMVDMKMGFKLENGDGHGGGGSFGTVGDVEEMFTAGGDVQMGMGMGMATAEAEHRSLRSGKGKGRSGAGGRTGRVKVERGVGA